MTLQGNIYGSLAVASVNAEANHALSNSTNFLNQRGFEEEITTNGQGDYTLVLQDGANLVMSGLVRTGLVKGQGADNAVLFGVVAVEYLTTTTLRVRVAHISTATPPVVGPIYLNFWIKISQFSPN